MNHLTNRFEGGYFSIKIGTASQSENAFVSAWNFYLTWSGRFIVNCFLFIFMDMDKWVYNICNTLVYLVFSWAMYALSIGKNEKFDIKIYLLQNLLLWYCLGAWGQCILWYCGSFQYLWAAFFYLLFLVPYRFQLDEVVKLSHLSTIGMFFLGIAAGCSGENAALAVFVGLFLYVLYKKNKKIPFELWEWIGIIGFSIGLVIQIASPGNRLRARHFDNLNNGIIEIIKHSLPEVFRMRGFIVPIIVFALLVLLHRKQDKVRRSFIAFAYMLIALVAHFSMLFSPFYPTRTAMPVICFGIIALSCLIKKIYCSDNAQANRIFKIAYLCFITPFPVSLYSAVKHSYLTLQSSERIIHHILSEKAKGNMDVVIETPLYPIDKHVANNISPMYSDPEKNMHFAKAFGVNSIKLTNDYDSTKPQ
jgi:hypothetical protein